MQKVSMLSPWTSRVIGERGLPPYPCPSTHSMPLLSPPMEGGWSFGCSDLSQHGDRGRGQRGHRVYPASNSVLVLSGIVTETPCKAQKFTSHVLEAGTSKVKAPADSGLRTHFLARRQPSSASSHGGGLRGLPGVSFPRALTPFTRAPPS